jgi:predicted O-methyltransferase YrrM
MSNDYQFTNNWFANAPEVWEHLIPMMRRRQHFLEIGSFEGRSTVWTLENMVEPGGFIDCVDTWEGSEEHVGTDMEAVKARFEWNIIRALGPKTSAVHREPGYPSPTFIRFASAGNDADNKRVYMYRTRSNLFLALKYPDPTARYDFIYIDGSHVARDVLTDACMAWQLLTKGGIMVFDDYLWGDPRDTLHRPKLAIDAFINIFAEDLTVLHVGNQLAIMRNQ